MILVAGESLIDLIVGPDDGVHASPGGGPFNAVRTIARLGQPTRFLGRFSADPFGQLLTGKLAQDGVELAVPGWVPEPTALAIVALGARGVPEYWFHVAQTAGFVLDQPTAQQALQADVTALHIGSLGLVVDPMAAELERLVAGLAPDVLLLLDPNWRAQAIPDADAHRARIRHILPRTDILKTSTEDLSFLVPGRGSAEAARILLGWGARCVLLTDGPSSVRAFTGGDELAVQVPPVEVVDTVGAGDAFGGAFLAWWAERGLAREDLARSPQLLAAVTAAARVASLTCARAGAEPPWRHELDTDEEWGQPLKQ
ncbi:MAG: carbohydrate kinase [Actinomycetia bacterium]|jgi:fructokinase|nr:carbohydrate kinase [Actinomycetes bacterium]